MTHILSDFKEGDKVFHSSQRQYSTRQHMIVIYVRSYNVKCSWITVEGFHQYGDFYPFELEILTNP